MIKSPIAWFSSARRRIFNNSSNKNSTESSNNNSEPVLESFSERLKILEEAIQEIDEAISARKELNKEFKNQIKKEIQEVENYLATLKPPWAIGFQLRYEFLRVSLHKSLTSRKKDKRSEELKFWEDLIGLIKERRKLLMEYQALAQAKKRLENSYGNG